MKHTSGLLTFFVFLVLASGAAAAPLDVWYWRDPVPQGNTLNGIAYGNGRLVATGDGGTVLISTNGLDWESHLRFDDNGEPIHMGAVAFGNGVFVSTRNYYGSWVSTDGVNWLRTYGPDVDSVVFCGGRFRGGNMVSSDGTNWNYLTLPFGAQVNGAAFGNGATVLVGNSGTIAVSLNGGSSWTVPNTGATQDLTCVAFDGQQFIAAGWHGALFVSSNGFNWVNKSFGNEYYFLAAASMPGLVAVAGYSYAAVQNTNITLIPTTDPAAVRGMTIMNSEFWAVGEGGRILRSTNGINWTEVSSRLPLTSTTSFYGVAFDGKKFIAANYRYLYASTNGTQWMQVSSPSMLYIHDITWGNGRFVAVGSDAAFPLGQPISSSTDGTNWVLHTVTPDYSDAFQRVFFVHDHLIAVGYNGRIATSPNGTNWTAQSLGINLDLEAAAYGDGKYLVGEGDNSNYLLPHSVLFSSTDLLTWSSNSVPFAENFWDMSYGRGIFLAAYIKSGGPEGLMWSRDGTHWFSQPGFAERLIYQNGVFVLAGVNYISTSFNGREFRLRNRMFNQSPYGIAFGNGTYVVVGSEGMILQSGLVPPAFMLAVELDNPSLGPLLRLDSPFDGLYDVQSSPDGSSWNTLFSSVQSSNGVFALRDTNGVSSGMKLYRAVLP